MSGSWSVSFTPIPAAGGHVYGAADLDDARLVVERTLADLFESSPSRIAVTIEIARPCEVCSGTGRRPKQRKKLFPDPCRAKDCELGFVAVAAETRLR